MGELKCLQLPPDTIAPLWAALRPKLLGALEYSRGQLDEASTFKALTSFKWQCWTVWEDERLLAVVVTRINTAPSGMRVLDALLAGGEERTKWQRAVVERLKEFMREEHCDRMHIWGRPGWERIYPEFKRTHILLEYRDEPR